MMRRKVGVYVKHWGATLIRGAATNRVFMVLIIIVYVSKSKFDF